MSKYNIRIIRSKRKTVTASVLSDGSVEVRAPLSLSSSKINKWIDSIEDKLHPMVERALIVNNYASKHPFGYNGEMLFLGSQIPIKQREDGKNKVSYENGEFKFPSGLSDNQMRIQMGKLLSELARPIFQEKMNYYSNLMKVNYTKWTVGSAKKRHGSCDSRGKIILSWRIIMMSEYVIDYIIVHELAHLKHMNHSKYFYNEVAATLPDWKDRKAKHAEFCRLLSCGGWI